MSTANQSMETPNASMTIPRAREGTCFFTVASTVSKISAAKPRNSVQRGANQLASGQL